MLNLHLFTLPALQTFTIALFSLLIWFALRSKSTTVSPFSSRTKMPGKDFFLYRTFFIEIGLILACSISYLFLEWTVYPVGYDRVPTYDYMHDMEGVEVVRTAYNSPYTEIVQPVQRPKENIIIEEIIGDEKVEFINEIIDDEEYVPAPVHPGSKIELPKAPMVPDFEEPDVPLIIAEQMPRFPGCEEINLTDQERKLCSEKNLLQFLNSNIKYPVVARENGIKGIVVIQFVVGMDGLIRDAAIVRDIGGDCGREALRVVELMRQGGINWTPGRQGGRPVSVRFSLPLKFQLE